MRIQHFALIVLSALLALGCGSQRTGVLSGAVTLNGQPLKKGNISLTPEGGAGGTAGSEIFDGRYSVPNLAVGKYRVHITGVPDGPVILPNSPEAKITLTPEQIRRMSDPLPADTMGNDELIDIQSGEQKKDFALASKSAK